MYKLRTCLPSPNTRVWIRRLTSEHIPLAMTASLALTEVHIPLPNNISMVPISASDHQKIEQMKKLIIITTILVLGVATSCSDDFLDAKPKAALSKEALQNAKGVNSLLIGAYSLLDGWATAEGAYRSYQVGADNWVYGSVASDDAYKGTIAGDQPPISLIEQHNITSDNI